MLVRVWHVKLEVLKQKKGIMAGLEHAAFPCEFQCVARVQVEVNAPSAALETAYRLTNHIDSDWTKNSGIFMYVCEPVRSSSVGDVFELDNGFYEVAPTGFQQLLI